MKRRKSILACLLLCAVALLAFAGAPVQAAKKTAKQSGASTASLGGTYYVGNAVDLKINGKAYNKAPKSKVIGKKTWTSKQGFSYADKTYAKGSLKLKYKTTNDYEVYFRKKGTYTLKYKTYDRNSSDSSINFDYSGEDTIVNPNDPYDYYYEPYYYMETYNYKTDKSTTGKTKYYFYTDKKGNSYYATKDKKSIYALSDENDSFVKATLSNNVIMLKPLDYTETTHTVTVKVVDSGPVVKSIKLGNAFYKSSSKYTDGGSTSSGSNNRFLSGKKGKLTVSMGSGCKIKSILVRTYNKKGEVVWKKVKNKKSVTFGNYVYKNSSSWGSSSSTNSGLLKETSVYIFYADKRTGGYCEVKSLKKGKDGSYTFKIQYKSDKKSKAVTETSYSPYGYGYYTSYTFYRK